jgi:hypothetical protein
MTAGLTIWTPPGGSLGSIGVVLDDLLVVLEPDPLADFDPDPEGDAEAESEPEPLAESEPDAEADSGTDDSPVVLVACVEVAEEDC